MLNQVWRSEFIEGAGYKDDWSDIWAELISSISLVMKNYACLLEKFILLLCLVPRLKALAESPQDGNNSCSLGASWEAMYPRCFLLDIPIFLVVKYSPWVVFLRIALLLNNAKTIMCLNPYIFLTKMLFNPFASPNGFVKPLCFTGLIIIIIVIPIIILYIIIIIIATTINYYCWGQNHPVYYYYQDLLKIYIITIYC